MASQTANGSYTQEGVKAALTTLIASGPWVGAYLRLFQSGFNPTFANVAADFEAHEANFHGYAPQGLAYGAVGIDSGGNPTILSTRLEFQATDGLVANTIAGCWVDTSQFGPSSSSSGGGPPGPGTSVEFYLFPNPVNIAVALAFLGVVLGVQSPGQSGYATVDY